MQRTTDEHRSFVGRKRSEILKHNRPEKKSKRENFAVENPISEVSFDYILERVLSMEVVPGADPVQTITENGYLSTREHNPILAKSCPLDVSVKCEWQLAEHTLMVRQKVFSERETDNLKRTPHTAQCDTHTKQQYKYCYNAWFSAMCPF
ncbi:hypothetical protein CBL_08903 [Carabus blaptoides fortunei]